MKRKGVPMCLLGKGVWIYPKIGVFPHKSRLHSRMEADLKNRAKDHPL